MILAHPDTSEIRSLSCAGKIVEMGAVDTVLLNPLHPYTQALIDAVSEPNPTNLQETKYIRIREGEII